jgi:DNA-binding transcriptional LysR family regulator
VNPIPHPELVLVDLFKDAVEIVVSVDRAPASDDIADAIEVLQAGQLIYAGRVTQCQELVSALAAKKLLPARSLTCGDLELVKSLTVSGVGIGLLPWRVAAYGQEGKIRRLHPSLPRVSDTISLAYRADLHRTRAAMRLKDALVAHGKKLNRTT